MEDLWPGERHPSAQEENSGCFSPSYLREPRPGPFAIYEKTPVLQQNALRGRLTLYVAGFTAVTPVVFAYRLTIRTISSICCASIRRNHGSAFSNALTILMPSDELPNRVSGSTCRRAGQRPRPGRRKRTAPACRTLDISWSHPCGNAVAALLVFLNLLERNAKDTRHLGLALAGLRPGDAQPGADKLVSDIIGTSGY